MYFVSFQSCKLTKYNHELSLNLPSEMHEKQFLFSVFRLSEFQYSLASVSGGVTVVLETDLLLQFGSKREQESMAKTFIT